MAVASSEYFKCETVDSCFTECETVKLSFKWTIENFLELQQANGEKIESEEFPSAIGQPAYWKLGLYRRGLKKENEDSVGLFLYVQSPQSANVRAKFTFESKDIHGITIVGPCISAVRTFSKDSPSWGFPNYVKRDLITQSLKKSKSDTFVIHCSITIFLDIRHHRICEPIDSCLSRKEKFKMSYKWTIKNFLELPQINGEVVESKVFPSHNESPAYWKLRVYPKGEHGQDGSVSLYVQQFPSETTKVSTKVTFVAEDIDGNIVVELRSEFHTFDKMSKNFGYIDYVNLDTLTESLKNSKSDTLVIRCSIIAFLDICDAPASGSGFSMSASDTRLSSDLQSLLLDESYKDFVINIDNRKFKVHKNILHARSSVFAAMLSSKMEEGNSSEVTLHDVDPDVFEKVLRFIYSDSLAMMESDALEILPVADKYNLDSLKHECINVLRITICKSTAVKTLILADAHSLEELKKVAARFICWNADVISKTEDWSLLLSSYPKLATELFLALAVDKTDQKE